MMSEAERMTIERFRALADAYGGVIARWPEAVRDAAAARAAEPSYAAVLAEADALDAALDQWRTPASSQALAARIVAAAPRRAITFGKRAKLWWSGLGLTTMIAGALAGSAAVAAVTPGEQFLSDHDTAFGIVLAEPGERP
jgi:hypothetical protein